MEAAAQFALSALAWLPACLFIVAAAEYAGHRWPLHHSWYASRLGLGRDHLAHHKLFARQFEWAHEVPNWYDAYAIRFAFGLLWALPISLPVWAWVSESLAVAFVLTAATHALVWQWLHNQMHRPTAGWIVRTRYFRFIREFHAVHHQKPRTNFGFLFAPFFDWLCGTYRTPHAR
jgi:hypothetical protein